MDFYGDYFSDPWIDYIVPPDYPGSPPLRRTPEATTQSQAPSYETPWYVDTINRAIERAAQVATVDVGGYPYPNYPLPPPLQPYPPQGVAPQPSGGIQLSQTTLMLIVGGFLLFTLGKRGR